MASNVLWYNQQTMTYTVELPDSEIRALAVNQTNGIKIICMISPSGNISWQEYPEKPVMPPSGVTLELTEIEKLAIRLAAADATCKPEIFQRDVSSAKEYLEAYTNLLNAVHKLLKERST